MLVIKAVQCTAHAWDTWPGAQLTNRASLRVVLLLCAPQCIIVVPTMELGVQCALTVYKLFGGNVSQGRPGDGANMFTYTGPRGIKVGCNMCFACPTAAIASVEAATCPWLAFDMCLKGLARAVHLQCSFVKCFVGTPCQGLCVGICRGCWGIARLLCACPLCLL